MIGKKEGHLKIKMALIVLFLILTFLLFLMQRNVKIESENIPFKIELVFEGKNEIYQKLIGKRELIEEKYVLSEVEEKNIFLKGTKINIIGIDENYSQINDIGIVSGEWITGEDQIVVSESIAKEINETLSIGETVDILGKEFVIVGIYENKKYSKSENVYINKWDMPESLRNAGETLYSLQFKPKDENRQNFIKEKLFEDIGLMLNGEAEIKIIDFTDSRKNLSKYYYGFIFLTEIAVFIFIMVYFIYSFKLYMKRYRVGIRRKYVKELIWENLTAILLETLKMVILIFIWVFLLRSILEFKLSTPSRFLPPTDIFDFKFYSQIRKLFNEEYGKTAAGYGKYYINLLRVAKRYFIKSVILLIGLLSVSLSYMKDKFKAADKNYNKLSMERREAYGKSSI